jgi:hypothetical protein
MNSSTQISASAGRNPLPSVSKRSQIALQRDLLWQPVEMQLDHLPERATGTLQPLPDLLKPESQLPQRFDLL